MKEAPAYPPFRIRQKDQSLNQDALEHYSFMVGVEFSGDHPVHAWPGGLVVLGEFVQYTSTHHLLVQEMEVEHAFQQMGLPFLNLSRN